METNTYNGHPSYNHWNVSLWINNEECTYNALLEAVEYAKREGVTPAAMYLRDYLPTATGDGVEYTLDLLAYVIENELDEIY